MAKERDREDRSPELTPAETMLLRCWAVDISPADFPSYGESLHDVVDRTDPWRDWLERAILAGHLPHVEGVELAIRALFMESIRLAEENRAQGLDGDAETWVLGWLEAIEHLGSLLADQEMALRNSVSSLVRRGT